MNDGFNYAPTGSRPAKVVRAGEFVFAAAHLDHGHIYGQVNGLLEAGGTLKYVYDPDADRAAAFAKQYENSGVKIAPSLEHLLADADVRLVASAAVPCARGPLGCRVMAAGKDYFTDKCPFTTLAQLAEARSVSAATGRKYMVYYSERVHVESAWHADSLVREGAIGQLIHASISGPHRLSKAQRPAWFFEKEKYGGILADIASHQCDQFLHYARATDGEVLHARVENFANDGTPELEDFGEAVFKLDNGVSCHSRVDWFTPDGLRTWGDGRTLLVGTRGFIEIRKYIDLGRDTGGDLILLANADGEQIIDCKGKVGFPFFGQLILDCLNRTEMAMTQAHAFKAAELSLKAQAFADSQRRG
ncbi:MAG: Gfo/Idh/MocA family oxidoreductase [Verrucomicrobiales bacterium]|jgi:predicted dehydrogenase|nr:Gfo/Idh/MocA family oxidoreductase [Verrucomicrobiales bacterium]